MRIWQQIKNLIEHELGEVKLTIVLHEQIIQEHAASSAYLENENIKNSPLDLWCNVDLNQDEPWWNAAKIHVYFAHLKYE